MSRLYATETPIRNYELSLKTLKKKKLKIINIRALYLL